MKNKQENIDEVLLLRVIESRASDSEKALFENWYESSIENAEFYNQLEKSYQLSLFDSNSVDANWKQVVDKISTGYTVPDYIELPETRETSRRLDLRMISRIAAVFLLVIGLSFLLKVIVFGPEQLIISGSEIKNNEPYTMVDGSLVYLHGNSEIRFQKKFGKKSREVILKGEAFFEIIRNENMPFVIKSNSTSIKVLGTSFNVLSEMSGQVKVNVVSGVVELVGDRGKSVKLGAGEQGTYNPEFGGIEKAEVSDLNFLAWRTGILVFQNTPLKNALVTLGQFYDRVLLYEGQKDEPAITTTFDNQPLEAVLEELNLLLNTKNEIRNETIIFKPAN